MVSPIGNNTYFKLDIELRLLETARLNFSLSSVILYFNVVSDINLVLLLVT